jgi:hypothetical protein
MKDKAWSWVQGGVVGAIGVAIVGQFWPGYMTDSNAKELALQTSERAVIAAFVPGCIELFNKQPDPEAKLTELKQVRSYEQYKFVADAGWATLPWSDKPNIDVARECAKLLIAPPAS